MVLILSLASLLAPAKTYSENENRMLAQFPALSGESILSGEFTDGVEEYLSDQFVLRDMWISLKTGLEIGTLHKEIDGVYLAKDGYYIEHHEDSALFGEQAAKNIDYIAEFVSSSDAAGVPVKVLLAPTAEHILDKKLPAFAPVPDYDAFITDARSLLGDSLLDTVSAFEDAEDEYIYYKTDHHWTTLGAYYAYEDYIRSLDRQPVSVEEFEIETASTEFLGTIHSKIGVSSSYDTIELWHRAGKREQEVTLHGESEIVMPTLYDREKLAVKDKYAVFLHGNVPVASIDTDAESGRRLLVIKDSYANCFVPFLTAHFSHIDVIDLRYYSLSISEFIATQEITDVLVLYSEATLCTETSIFKIRR